MEKFKNFGGDFWCKSFINKRVIIKNPFDFAQGKQAKNVVTPLFLKDFFV
jgi:hypothetical protein